MNVNIWSIAEMGRRDGRACGGYLRPRSKGLPVVELPVVERGIRFFSNVLGSIDPRARELDGLAVVSYVCRVLLGDKLHTKVHPSVNNNQSHKAFKPTNDASLTRISYSHC